MRGVDVGWRSPEWKQTRDAWRKARRAGHRHYRVSVCRYLGTMSRPPLDRCHVAYAPDTQRPICPRCWSRPDLHWGKGRTAGERGMRGWGVSRSDPVEVDGVVRPVAVAVHRCSNRHCQTALVVGTLLDGGYVPSHIAEGRLSGADSRAYLAGRHGADGVWHDASGEPRTAPVQRELFA